METNKGLLLQRCYCCECVCISCAVLSVHWKSRGISCGIALPAKYGYGNYGLKKKSK